MNSIIETVHTVFSFAMLVSASRERVKASFEAAKTDNFYRFSEGRDPSATSEYVYPNQIEDAEAICNMFYSNRKLRGISIIKRTKVGMNGLMIQIMNFMCSIHPDDNFIIRAENVIIATGMSNVAWETDLKKNVPHVFKDNIFHHGKLQNLKKKLETFKNGLIIIDEIDTGDKVGQKLHKILKTAGILDFAHMEKNNIRLIFVSATMSDQLEELNKWGEYHDKYMMSVPQAYFGHGDFLSAGFYKEFYNINCVAKAEKWIKEDIIDNYGNDYRVHIIRTNLKQISYIDEACGKNNIKFGNFSRDKDYNVTADEIKAIFQSDLKQHVVIAIKGFYRRANLIPNKWKLKIGATHEMYTVNPNTSVQIQGLPGRMTGYWRSIIMAGHKTGPHRTSLAAIQEYENWYLSPEMAKYKKNPKKSFVGPENFKNNDECILNTKPVIEPEIYIEKFKNFEDLKKRFIERLA